MSTESALSVTSRMWDAQAVVELMDKVLKTTDSTGLLRLETVLRNCRAQVGVLALCTVVLSSPPYTIMVD